MDVTKLGPRVYTRRELWVTADQLENRKHAVRDIAEALVQELTSPLRLNGYVYSVVVMCCVGLWDSTKPFGDIYEQRNGSFHLKAPEKLHIVDKGHRRKAIKLMMS